MSLGATESYADRETAASSADRKEIRTWLRLLTCTNLIERELRARLNREFQTTLPRFDVLAQLEREPAGLIMGQISARMMVTGGNLTGVVDRLVADGLVERLLAPGDRRSNIVRLTASGRNAFERMAAAHHETLHGLLAGLARSDLDELFDAMGRLKATLRSNLSQ